MASRRGISTAAIGLVAVAGALAACSSGGSGAAAGGTPTTTVTSTAIEPTRSATGSPVVPSSTPASGGGGGGGTTLCTPTVSKFSVEDTGGAAGHAGVAIHVTNASQSPCVTTGWPGVAVLDAQGTQVAQAQRTGSEGPTITLQPGQEATALLEWANMGQGTGTCTPASAILFTLPDNTDSTKLNVQSTACDVTVQTLVAGTGS